MVRKGDGVRLTAEYGWETAEAGLKHVAYRVDYTLYPDGELHAALHYAPSVTTETYDTDKLNAGTHDGAAATFTPKTEEELKTIRKVLEIPRIGVRFRIPAAFDHISYFGRGPEENYAATAELPWDFTRQRRGRCIPPICARRRTAIIRKRAG